MTLEVNILMENNEDSYSDPEGYIDDVTDQEIIGDVLAQEPSERQYEENCIMVFNIPLIGEERLPKLRNVLSALFSLQGLYQFTDHFPLDENNKTKGYCFVEYQTKEAASAACIACDGFKLDKNHTFSAYPLNAMRDIKEPEKDWKKPEKRPYQDVGDLWWWLQNPKSLDQFSIQFQIGRDQDKSSQLDVYWHSRNNEPMPVSNAQRMNWTEDKYSWSPHGSYMATMHKQGVALWAGEKFEKIQRVAHENVNYIEFTPNEKYLVTYARDDQRFGDSEDCLRIFDVFTSEVKKAFSPAGHSSAKLHTWPFLKWSHDEKYFAFSRPKGNCINVFETENFTLGSKIELDGLVQFEFNPARNLIAYYCEERQAANAPAEFGLIELPSRTKVRAQRIYSVSAANIFWQKAGAYLAAHTERYTTKKIKDGEYKYSGITSHLEIFDCTGKEVSVQTLQLPEPFVNFSWEPKGDKFCVLVGTGNKVTPLIYKLDPGKTTPSLISRLDSGIQLNSIEWAPHGGWLTVLSANSPGGQVLFIDTNGQEVTITKKIEHPYLKQGCWDPTSRYFVTCTMARSRSNESGYRIHTFQGREILRKSVDSLINFTWRPRPPVQLSDQKVKEIRKQLKQLAAKFDEEDRKEQLKVSKELIESRRKMMAEFSAFRVENLDQFRKEEQERLKLRGGMNMKTLESDLVDETITIALSTEMEQLKENGVTTTTEAEE